MISVRVTVQLGCQPRWRVCERSFAKRLPQRQAVLNPTAAPPCSVHHLEDIGRHRGCNVSLRRRRWCHHHDCVSWRRRLASRHRGANGRRRRRRRRRRRPSRLAHREHGSLAAARRRRERGCRAAARYLRDHGCRHRGRAWPRYHWCAGSHHRGCAWASHRGREGTDRVCSTGNAAVSTGAVGTPHSRA